MSHHVEQLTLRGKAFSAGDVWRNPRMQPWGEHVILGFSAHGGDHTEVKLARPYAYASSVGTTGPVLLQGREDYTLPIEHLMDWIYLGGGFRT